jgi:RimJ/RimL family protein N-acetyltransferase
MTSVTQAPILETDRLLLRGHRASDFGDLAAMWADPAVVQYVGGKPSTSEESWARLLRYVGHWALLGYGFWALAERATGRFVGDVGIAEFQRAGMAPPLDPVPEVGWVLAAWAHGKGYATEAMRAILAWSDGRGGPLASTTCIINPDNAGSLRVAAKCGFAEVRRADYVGKPIVVLRR